MLRRISLTALIPVCLLGLSLLAPYGVAWASGKAALATNQDRQWQDLSGIASGAQSYLLSELQATFPGDEIEVSIAAIDPRLRLHACDKALTYEQRSGLTGASNVTLRVICSGQQPWFFYLTGTVKHSRPVLIASRNLIRGELLTSSDVLLQPRDISSLGHTVISDPQNALGQQVKRSISKGEAVRSSSLEAPQVISKGDQVVIKAIADELTVSSSGTALNNGKVGQQIRVRNLQGDKVIRALVTARGQVEVRL